MRNEPNETCKSGPMEKITASILLITSVQFSPLFFFADSRGCEILDENGWLFNAHLLKSGWNFRVKRERTGY